MGLARVGTQQSNIWKTVLNKELGIKEQWQHKWSVGGFIGVVPMGEPTKPPPPWRPPVPAKVFGEYSPPVSPTSPIGRVRLVL